MSCQTLGFENDFLCVLHSPVEGAVCHPEEPRCPTPLTLDSEVDRCTNIYVRFSLTAETQTKMLVKMESTVTVWKNWSNWAKYIPI